jgi:hypothetical protein
VFGQGEPLSSLEQGARIRLTAETVPESERVGRLVSISVDSIQFRPDSHPGTRSISLKSVRTLEVSRETRTRRSEYATVAAIVGGVIGYVASNHNGQGLGTGKTDASQNALVGGIAGVALGGGLGWWYGGKKKVENWHPVDR